MQHRFAVMYQSVHHVAAVDVPHAHSGVTGTADDDLVVVLEAQHRTGVTGKDLRFEEMFNNLEPTQSGG